MNTQAKDFSIEEKRAIEARKMQVDALKQLATINTASLVLSATLIDLIVINKFHNSKDDTAVANCATQPRWPSLYHGPCLARSAACP